MFDENQLVEIKCHPKTKHHYINKGYEYTKNGDAIFVKAKDLTEGSNVNIEVTCDFCGELYYPKYVNYNNRSNKKIDACNNCRTLKGSKSTLEERAKNHFKKIREFCNKNDYILLTNESEYKDGYTTILYECKKHGIKRSNAEMMVAERGCKECWYEQLSENLTLSNSYVKEKIEEFNGNKLLNPDDYCGSRIRNLKILCNCGREYISSYNEYMSGDAKRCPMCSSQKSKGEFAIFKFLEENLIDFVYQYKFEDCKDKLALPFDFYLPNYNMCIEYNGRQHYEPVEYFGGEEGFKYTVKHDEMKNEYCNKNNINILTIPYWQYKDIEGILTKQLNL